MAGAATQKFVRRSLYLNKIMKIIDLLKNKKILSGLGILAVLVTLMINSSNNEKVFDGENQDNLFDNILTEREKIELDLELNKPQKIDWQIDNFEGGKSDILKTDNNTIDLSKEDLFLETVGLDKSNKVSDEDGFVVYQKGENLGAYINKNDGYFQYSEEISKPNQLTFENRVDLDLLRNRLMETVKRITGTSLEIRIEGSEFKRMVYPRWVTANEDEAQTVEMGANYYVDGEPIANIGGEAIKAVYTLGGRLIKLEIKQPFKTIFSREETELVGLEEIKDRLMAKFYILEEEGGESYELSDGSEEIGLVVVNILKKGRWFNSKSKEVVPVYILEGSSVLSTGPVKIKMMTAAEK